MVQNLYLIERGVFFFFLPILINGPQRCRMKFFDSKTERNVSGKNTLICNSGNAMYTQHLVRVFEENLNLQKKCFFVLNSNNSSRLTGCRAGPGA